MQVSVEAQEGLHRRLTVQLPWEEIDSKTNLRLAELQQNVKINGFRPGKVPLREVKRRYGKSAEQDAINGVIEQRLQDAIVQESLRVAGDLKMDVIQAERDKPFEFSATFEVYPTIELKELDGLEVTQLESTVTEQDIDVTIERLLERSKTWEEVDRAAQLGDRVTINTEGKVNGEVFPEGTMQDFKLELGSKQTIAGFEDGIVGAKAGETIEVPVTFPEDYFAAALAPKDAVFTITVDKVEQAIYQS